MTSYNISELHLSHSSLALYHSCNRKLEFRKFLRHPGSDESIPAEVGKALHVGYQEFLQSGNLDMAIGKMLVNHPIHLASNPAYNYSPEACYATMEMLCRSGHLVEYELAQVRCLDGSLRPAVEVPFSIRMKGFDLRTKRQILLRPVKPIEVYYDGFIDAIMFNRLTGEYVVVDLKTTRQDLSVAGYKYTFDEQLLPYAYVLEHVLNERVDNLSFKYLCVYVDLVNPQSRMLDFHRTSYDIRSWAEDLMVDLYNIKLQFNSQRFRRQSGGCFTYNRPCQFWDVCQYDTVEQVKTLIAMDNRDYYESKIEPWVKLDLEIAA